ncbi:hypothetical protein C5E51_28055 [Nocardia nova]|nr:hypothetical protein C5E51_28055 [Nocardia nova]
MLVETLATALDFENSMTFGAIVNTDDIAKVKQVADCIHRMNSCYAKIQLMNLDKAAKAVNDFTQAGVAEMMKAAKTPEGEGVKFSYDYKKLNPKKEAIVAEFSHIRREMDANKRKPWRIEEPSKK